MRKRNAVLAALVLVTVAALSYAAGAAQEKEPVNMAAGDLEWQPIAPDFPIQIAVLWGDRTSGGEYGMLLKLPAGFEVGMHSHTADYHAVSLQGTWVHTNEGDAAVELPPGSYVMQPGKQNHNDACKGATDCLLFVQQNDASDFIPAEAPAGE